jgi:hypothetical protein
MDDRRGLSSGSTFVSLDSDLQREQNQTFDVFRRERRSFARNFCDECTFDQTTSRKASQVSQNMAMCQVTQRAYFEYTIMNIPSTTGPVGAEIECLHSLRYYIAASV